jgi:aminopeptidase N
MGFNETKYAWMDEGLTSMGDYLFMGYQKKPRYQFIYFDYLYRNQIGHDLDIPIFARSDILRSPVYYNNAYSKSATFFLILRDVLGADLFKQTLLEFMNVWNGKHPSPYDLFYFFQEVSGQDIEWLIKPWFFEYGYVDLAVKKVSRHNDQYRIVIERKGRYPAPIRLKILYGDGSAKIIHKKASVWKEGNTTYTITQPVSKIIQSVELPEKSYLDADVTNNKLVSQNARDKN